MPEMRNSNKESRSWNPEHSTAGLFNPPPPDSTKNPPPAPPYPAAAPVPIPSGALPFPGTPFSSGSASASKSGSQNPLRGGADFAGPPPPAIALRPEDPNFRSHEYWDPKTGRVQRFETVQDRLLNVFGGILAGIFRSSKTVVRVDLVRPYNPKKAQLYGEGEQWDRAQRGERRRRRLRGQGYEAMDGYLGGKVQGLDRGFYGNGAQLKIMQVWRVKDDVTQRPKLPWGLNFGCGANLDIDNGRLHFLSRLSSDHLVLRLLPRPDLEVKGKWRLGGTRLGVDVRYRVPVPSPEQLLESGPGLGYLTLRLFNWEGSGFSLSPDGGLEFDDQVVRWGTHTKFRAAAKVTFPQYFPLEDDEDPFFIEIRRLGFKTVLG